MSLKDISTRLRSIPVELPAEVAANAAPAIEAKAKATAPVATGRLRDSLTAVAAGSSVVVSSSVNYARFNLTEQDYTPELDEAVNAV
jgi:hypothetical protein